MSEERPVVICFDGSEESRRAASEAGRLFPGARALVLHVWQSIESTMAYRYSAAGLTGALKEAMDELEASGQAAAEAVAEEGAQLARQAGLEAEPVAVEAPEHVWSTVVDLLERRDASVAVMGTRGLGPVESRALGGFSNAVVHHSRRPVLLIPRPSDR
jgi:nucleotide-binding universal stress UspA family protein